MVGHGSWLEFPELPPKRRDAHLKRRDAAQLEALDAELFKPRGPELRKVWQGPITPAPLPHLSQPLGKGTWVKYGEGFVVHLDPIRRTKTQARADLPAWFQPRINGPQPRKARSLAGITRPLYRDAGGVPRKGLFDWCRSGTVPQPRPELHRVRMADTGRVALGIW